MKTLLFVECPAEFLIELEMQLTGFIYGRLTGFIYVDTAIEGGVTQGYVYTPYHVRVLEQDRT